MYVVSILKNIGYVLTDIAYKLDRSWSVLAIYQAKSLNIWRLYFDKLVQFWPNKFPQFIDNIFDKNNITAILCFTVNIFNVMSIFLEELNYIVNSFKKYQSVLKIYIKVSRHSTIFKQNGYLSITLTILWL